MPPNNLDRKTLKGRTKLKSVIFTNTMHFFFYSFRTEMCVETVGMLFFNVLQN